MKPSKNSPTLCVCVCCVDALVGACALVCICAHACTLRAGFSVKGRECVHIMAHGYLLGQFYATFQLLPKFVFSSWSHCSYLQFIQDRNIYSMNAASARFCEGVFKYRRVAATLWTCTNNRNKSRPLCAADSQLWLNWLLVIQNIITNKAQSLIQTVTAS